MPVPASQLRAWFLIIASGVAVFSSAGAQETLSSLKDGWQRSDWLAAPTDQSSSALGTFTKSTGQDLSDPFAVISNGSLWQEKCQVGYTRPLADSLSLHYEAISAALTSTPGDDTTETKIQKAALQFKPMAGLTVSSDVHETTNETSLPVDSVFTGGTGFTAETHLPLDSIFTVGVNRDDTTTPTVGSSQTTAYNAQVRQPVGKIPLTAVLKWQFQETDTSGVAASRLPSLEQSLIWKPAEDTTLEVGLRQQHYQDFPGINNALNEAVFADWSQKILGEVTWHSYAEMLNSRSTIEVAAAGMGANGTAQPTLPGSNVGLVSSLPVSVTDEALTFSTGPSFQLQKDISASIEYSNRWDQTPSAGAMGAEQRVSVSLKGTF